MMKPILFVSWLLASSVVLAENKQNVQHQALANQVKGVLKASCFPCHGQPGRRIRGNFSAVLDHKKITSKGGHLALMLERINDREDPMPPIGAREKLNARDRKLIQAWVDAGTPAWEQVKQVPFVSGPKSSLTEAEVIALVQKDLQAAPRLTAPYLRYFSFNHLPYKLRVSYSVYTDALTKLLNFLSTKRKIVIPRKVNGSPYLLRVDMRSLGWNDNAWKAYKENYPYRELSQFSKASYALARADHFIAKASQGDLYFGFLGIPLSERELERKLSINTVQSIRKSMYVRSGMRVSKTEANNRIIEGHVVGGEFSYWRSFNFEANTKRGNIFEFPLGPPEALEGFERDYGFEHADSDILYFLPNGMHAYLTTNPSRIREAEANVATGLRCIGCHGNGLIYAKDQVGPAVAAAEDAFDGRVARKIQRIYLKPEKFKRILKKANEPFLKGLKAMRLVGAAEDDLNATSPDTEPINVIVREYDAELSVEAVLADIGANRTELAYKLKKNPRLKRAVGTLLTKGGGLRRDTFELHYLQLRVLPKGTTLPGAGLLRKGTVVSFPIGEYELRGVLLEDSNGDPDKKLRIKVLPQGMFVKGQLRVRTSLLKVAK